MYYALRSIPDPAYYISAFELQAHIDELVIQPHVWQRTKIRDDDKWGVDLHLISELSFDPYFQFKDLLSHDKFERSIFEDQGYTDSFEQVRIIKAIQMEYYNGIAANVRGEIIKNINDNYNKEEHLAFLEAIKQHDNKTIISLLTNRKALREIEEIEVYFTLRDVKYSVYQQYWGGIHITTYTISKEIILSLIKAGIITAKRVVVYGAKKGKSISVECSTEEIKTLLQNYFFDF